MRPFALSAPPLLTILLAAAPAPAVTYYVDSRTGDDAALGTSPQSPWRSYANLETKAFAPGDNVLFARGSTYTGGFTFASSGPDGKPIRFGAYGPATDPLPSF